MRRGCLGFFDPSVPCIDAEGPPPSSIGRKLSFGPRSVIFLEGDEARSIFQVIDGAVMLYKLLPDGRRQVVEVLGAGDVFGCSLPAVRDCSAETLLATRCLAVGREFVEGSPALVRWLNLRLRAQLCALHEHVTLLGAKVGHGAIDQLCGRRSRIISVSRSRRFRGCSPSSSAARSCRSPGWMKSASTMYAGSAGSPART